MVRVLRFFGAVGVVAQLAGRREAEILYLLAATHRSEAVGAGPTQAEATDR